MNERKVIVLPGWGHSSDMWREIVSMSVMLV
jgi:hypothetical protein